MFRRECTAIILWQLVEKLVYAFSDASSFNYGVVAFHFVGEVVWKIYFHVTLVHRTPVSYFAKRIVIERQCRKTTKLTLTCWECTRSIAGAVSGWLLLLPLAKDAVVKSELRFPEIADILLEPLEKGSPATVPAEVKCFPNINSSVCRDVFGIPREVFLKVPLVKIIDPLSVAWVEEVE